MLEVSIKTPKEVLFRKQTGVFTLHTKSGLVVRGHLELLCMFIVTWKTNVYVFQTAACGCLHSVVSIEYVTAPVSLTERVCMLTFHHLKNDSKSRQRHYW